MRGVGYIHRRTYYDGRRANFCKSGNGTTFVFCSAVLPMSQWVTWYNHVCNSPPRLPGLLLYAVVVSPLHCAHFCQKSSIKCGGGFLISLKKVFGLIFQLIGSNNQLRNYDFEFLQIFCPIRTSFKILVCLFFSVSFIRNNQTG